jgi:hypothetical protein
MVYVTRVEAESNTSTVTLRVVVGDEKGSLKSETVKYGHPKLGYEALKARETKICAGRLLLHKQNS